MALPPEQRQALIEAFLEQQSGQTTNIDEATSARQRPATNELQSADENNVSRMRDTPREPPKLVGGNTVVISVDGIDTDRADDARTTAELNESKERILRGNPYRLDGNGQLQMVGYPGIALAGLTEAQATMRLISEPSLRRLRLRITLLPLAANESETLEPFGYDMLDDAAGAFAPAANMPVPTDYRLGPGDSLRLALVGAQNRRLTLEVDRNGEIQVPDLGPLVVAGMTFEEAKTLLEAQVTEKLIGTQGSVSMGTLRTIRIFILGEAKVPGSYVVNGLSTISNALVLGGGVSPVGSLRNVQLKRAGSTVATLDLYEMLLNGNTRGDARLQQGDVIFIPPVGATVGISGAVRRPAIYEMGPSVSMRAGVDALVRLAGGLNPDADPAMATIERIAERGDRIVLNVDLRGDSSSRLGLKSGDVVRVPTIRPTFSRNIRIEGHVHRPGAVGFVPGARLIDVLKSVDELKPDADLHYVLIRRETKLERTARLFSVDLAEAFKHPQGPSNVELRERDRIIVFDLNSDRENIIAPIMAELRRQSSAMDQLRIVTVGGRVKVPGEYPLEAGMRVSDLLRAGGGLDDAAYTGAAELARYTITNGEKRQVELISIDLKAIQDGDDAANVALLPYDQLLIKEVPLWTESESIRLLGEVRFPGEYPIRRGETLESVIERAGGFTDLAFPEGSVFTRKELRAREQRQLDDLAERMRRDLALFALQANRNVATTQQQGDRGAGALAVGESLLTQIQSSRAVGRLVIDLKNGSASGDDDSHTVIVKDGDSLYVPRVTQEVTVIGEVQNPSSHLYRPDLTRDEYVRLSGGVTLNGDESSAYVIRANGSVESLSGSVWFARASNVDIRPGDSIVVPLDTQRTLPLPLWTSVSAILYNLAVAVAAVNSF